MAVKEDRRASIGSFPNRRAAELFIAQLGREGRDTTSCNIVEGVFEGENVERVSVWGDASLTARKRPETGHTGPKKKKRYHLMDKALDALMTPLSYSVGISMLAKEKRKK